MIKKLLTVRAARYVIIGLCNAAISFGILNIAFYKLHQSKILSSIIATTCALLFSFLMNRVFVFNDREKKARQQLPAFVIVTITGSILVLNIVYILSLRILSGNEELISKPIAALFGISLSSNFIDINMSTVFGAIVAMFWNYYGYKRFVFKGQRQALDVTQEKA